MKNSKKIGIILMVIGIMMIGTGYFLRLTTPSINNKSVTKQEVEINDDKYVKEHYEKWAKVLKIEDVKDNKDIMSEKEVYKFLEERGFDIFEIKNDYTMDGDIIIDSESDTADPNSDTKHPIYTMTFSTLTSERIWMLAIVGKSVSVFPAIDEENETPIIVESKTLTSYNVVNNKYYHVIPNDDEMNLKIVKKIDFKTIQEIDKQMPEPIYPDEYY